MAATTAATFRHQPPVSSPPPRHAQELLDRRVGLAGAARPEPLSEPDDLPEHGQVVYFVEGANGLIKVGTTCNLASRLRDLRAMSATPISVLAWVPGGKDVELTVHHALALHRAHGEWFEPAPLTFEIIRYAREEEWRFTFLVGRHTYQLDQLCVGAIVVGRLLGRPA